ncbi:MAG: hypothetical protein C0518_04605 [Opitutus sp.]|nr:hypothetical protein [Opitutus sp.]
MAPPSTSPALLIAVTGSPGQGRTALLARLAAEFRAAGQRVEGVLAGAEERRAPDEGALRYRLHILGEADELPWAERVAQGADNDAAPPYVFNAETHRRLRLWADGLRMQPPTPLLVLDEFGRFEAQGEGLMPLWPTLSAAAPHIVVCSVREHLVAEIEARLGRSFDLRIAARATDAASQLRRACADFGEWTRLGLWGGAAGGVEISAGSLLHAARVPFRGLALSSLQAATMTFASAGLSQPSRVVWVPLVSAGLKAFSPGGGRVRPMVAIATQGALFAGSVQVLGWNVAGLAVGSALVGAWAALQGFFLQYLLLGTDLVVAYDRLVQWLAQNWQFGAPGMPALLAAWTALHILAAVTATLLAWQWRQPPRLLKQVLDRELANFAVAPAKATPPRATWWGRVLHEFARWQFWLPLALVAFVLLATGRHWESVAWLALRFAAVGFVLIALLSLFQPAWLAEKLRRRGWWGPAAAFAGAFRRHGPTR